MGIGDGQSIGVLNNGVIKGGNGGNGGNSTSTEGGAGGGGVGGPGIVVIFGSRKFESLNRGTITGGNGGAGGSTDFIGTPRPGKGGDGGIGFWFDVRAFDQSARLVNSGAIAGGNGAAGIRPGAGGAGVAGNDFNIINNGTITGGLSGDGVTRADAIVFTGGTNFLSGTGTVGSFTLPAGSTFAPGSGAPGSFMTVNGNLAFASGATYLVQINGAGQASRANVNGSATLGGANVQVVASGRVSFGQIFNILTATGGVSGTFGDVSLIGNFNASLDYHNPQTVELIITEAGLGAGLSGNQAGLSGNQQNVAGAINNFFNSGGTLPPGFTNLFFLTDANLANALTLLSGEVDRITGSTGKSIEGERVADGSV